MSATILRIKRKRTEEPLDAFVVEARVRDNGNRQGHEQNRDGEGNVEEAEEEDDDEPESSDDVAQQMAAPDGVARSSATAARESPVLKRRRRRSETGAGPRNSSQPNCTSRQVFKLARTVPIAKRNELLASTGTSLTPPSSPSVHSRASTSCPFADATNGSAVPPSTVKSSAMYRLVQASRTCEGTVLDLERGRGADGTVQHGAQPTRHAIMPSPPQKGSLGNAQEGTTGVSRHLRMQRDSRESSKSEVIPDLDGFLAMLQHHLRVSDPAVADALARSEMEEEKARMQVVSQEQDEEDSESIMKYSDEEDQGITRGPDTDNDDDYVYDIYTIQQQPGIMNGVAEGCSTSTTFSSTENERETPLGLPYAMDPFARAPRIRYNAVAVTEALEHADTVELTAKHLWTEEDEDTPDWEDGASEDSNAEGHYANEYPDEEGLSWSSDEEAAPGSSRRWGRYSGHSSDDNGDSDELDENENGKMDDDEDEFGTMDLADMEARASQMRRQLGFPIPLRRHV